MFQYTQKRKSQQRPETTETRRRKCCRSCKIMAPLSHAQHDPVAPYVKRSKTTRVDDRRYIRQEKSLPPRISSVPTLNKYAASRSQQHRGLLPREKKETLHIQCWMGERGNTPFSNLLLLPLAHNDRVFRDPLVSQVFT